MSLLILLSGCKAQSPVYEKDWMISVTLLNGEHYSIVGENKKKIIKDSSVSFNIVLERGHKIVGAYGNDCEVTDSLSFTQTVSLTNVKYTSTVRLETEKMSKSDFMVSLKDSEAGNIYIDTILGNASETSFFTEDTMNITVEANIGFRFQCWSVGNFLNEGGSFYSYDTYLENFDFENTSCIYANFKNMSDTGNEIFYLMGNGLEIEQDCTELLEHHPRANTYTAVDLREKGIDCDSRMLIGWETKEGEYVGLGSRVAVSDFTATLLYPIWKEYTDLNEFVYEEIKEGEGKITNYTGEGSQEVIIPNKINGIKITAIGSNAFEQCNAQIYYLPDTITIVEDNAFLNCKNLKELYMSDNISDIDDKSFTGCENFATLHINAVLKPRYIGIDTASYKTDVYDRLALSAINGNRKFVVLGGSSVYYAYNIKNTIDLFNDNNITLDAFNLGYNASYCLAAQFEIAKQYLEEDDIFLFAPEHYSGVWCSNEKFSPLTNNNEMSLTDGYLIYRLTEGNWQFFSGLTVKNYSNLFSMFKQFNQDRFDIAEGSYAEYRPTYDDSIYGPHTTGDSAEYPWGKNESFHENVELNKPANADNALINICDVLIAKGVKVFLTFPPVNRHALLLTYDSEENLRLAAERYTEEINSFVEDREITVICTQYETIYDGAEFVDHNYHLGHPKRNNHTHKIIEELIEALLAKENVE